MGNKRKQRGLLPEQRAACCCSAHEHTTQSRTGLCGPLRMWARAPSQAAARADRGGVPSRSVIRSSCDTETDRFTSQKTRQRFGFVDPQSWNSRAAIFNPTFRGTTQTRILPEPSPQVKHFNMFIYTEIRAERWMYIKSSKVKVTHTYLNIILATPLN